MSLEQGEYFKMGFRSLLQLTKKVARLNQLRACFHVAAKVAKFSGLSGSKVEPATGVLPCGSQGG